MEDLNWGRFKGSLSPPGSSPPTSVTELLLGMSEQIYPSKQKQLTDHYLQIDPRLCFQYSDSHLQHLQVSKPDSQI